MSAEDSSRGPAEKIRRRNSDGQEAMTWELSSSVKCSVEAWNAWECLGTLRNSWEFLGVCRMAAGVRVVHTP